MKAKQDKNTTAFRKRLSQAGLSERRFAREIGKHQSTVNRWSRGILEVPPYAWLCLDTITQRSSDTKR